jgi:hypothetical protein
VLPMGTKYRNHIFYRWLFDLQSICDKYGLKTLLSPNNDFRKCLLAKQHSWNKNEFCDVEKGNDLNGVNIVLLSYLITLMAYLCSQCSPYVQMKYFMFDWSIYMLFVLNRGWKCDTLQMMTFVYVCTTFSVVEIKTRFETCNEVNGVNTSHIS